jgi:hypothetical protein
MTHCPSPARAPPSGITLKRPRSQVQRQKPVVVATSKVNKDAAAPPTRLLVWPFLHAISTRCPPRSMARRRISPASRHLPHRLLPPRKLRVEIGRVQDGPDFPIG